MWDLSSRKQQHPISLQKYYPPDFDPSKIPKLKLPKDRQYVVRLMAPFNMRCKTCGEYIYKGKKFNARKETVQNEAYLGLPIFRFYIKCTRCLAEITFKTDPENTDYTMEHGATRNFQAEKLLEEEEKRVLENRTKDSKLEMEVLENLQELKDLNQRQAHVDFEAMLLQHRLSQEQRRQQQEEEDERETAALLEEARHRRLLEDSDSEDEAPPSRPPAAARPNPTAILDEALKAKRKAEAVGSRAQLAGLVVPKKVKVEANGGSEQVRMPATGAPESRKAANLAPQIPGASSLNQLGAYGDSEDSDS
ncbi:hypothetical protein A6R68_23112 [Neotoma lepida]|uniref:Splicing factor YJU2 n=1 Tax=Neotoma lepida TaxID=56216 RepID=A0A1A6HXD4_NEOLE|nr:hypothetical protein A6R68_23112 [Neotoma lepida]